MLLLLASPKLHHHVSTTYSKSKLQHFVFTLFLFDLKGVTQNIAPIDRSLMLILADQTFDKMMVVA